jgi:hypothetical protein
MVSSNAISLIVAGVSLVGTVVVAIYSAWKQQSIENLRHNREVDKEVKKYSGPLAVAAWELQERLYDLIETSISAAHVDDPAGYENLAIMSSFLLAQYLAWAFILREKTQFLSFTGRSKWKRLRTIMYKIDDELDRKVDRQKGIFGHFPADRLRISEKAIVWDVNDGILRSIRWNEFLDQWESDFKPRLGWYIRQIIVNTVMAKAENKKPKDERLRRMQHQLIDLVNVLDAEGILEDDRPSFTRKCKTSRWCDCERKECQPGPKPSDKLEARTRRERHDNFYGPPQQSKESTGGVAP